MEGQVPGRVPGVLPLVRHRDDVGVQHVKPFRVPHAAAAGFHERMTLVLLEPSIHIEVVVLLAPQHARQRLAVHPALVLAQRLRRDPLVELVGVGDPALECLLEAAEGVVGPGGGQTEADGLAAAGGHVEHIVGRGLGPDLGGVDRVAAARDDVFVERVLDVRGRIGLAPETGRVALVLGEEQLRGSVAHAASTRRARGGWPESTPGRASRSDGFRSSSPQDQVLRNHSVGRTRSRAASGPRLCTVMRTRMSSGPSFAYSTNTSKYRSSSKAPVSSSSYSNSSRDRPRFVSIRSR